MTSNEQASWLNPSLGCYSVLENYKWQDKFICYHFSIKQIFMRKKIFQKKQLLI
jgi:hypothetical protein